MTFTPAGVSAGFSDLGADRGGYRRIRNADIPVGSVAEAGWKTGATRNADFQSADGSMCGSPADFQSVLWDAASGYGESAASE